MIRHEFFNLIHYFFSDFEKNFIHFLHCAKEKADCAYFALLRLFFATRRARNCAITIAQKKTKAFAFASSFVLDVMVAFLASSIPNLCLFLQALVGI